MKATSSNETRWRRRFACVMLLALLPLLGISSWVLAHRYGVYPFESSNRVEWILSEDTPIFLREMTIGLPFTDVRQRYDAFDMRTGKRLWTWVPKDQVTYVQSISDDGSRMCVRVGELYFIYESEPPHKRLREVPLTWSGDRPWRIHWVDNDTRWIYSDGKNGFRIIDLKSGDDHSIANSAETYPFLGYWPHDDWYLTVSNAGNPAIPQKVYQRQGHSLVAMPELNHDRETQGFVFRGGTRLHFHGSSSMIDLDTGNSISLDLPETANGKESGCLARFTDELTYYHHDAELRVTGATLINSEDGTRGEYCKFDSPADKHTFHIFRDDRFHQLDQTGTIASVDRDGRRTILHESPRSRWFRFSVLAIAALAAWWLLWVLGMRRSDRSIQPGVDIALLHALLFFPSTIRLFSGSYDWRPAQPESVVFFSATQSGIAVLLLWFVFGTNDWRRRCTQAILVTAAVFGVYILLWSGSGGWHMGMLLPAYVATCLVVFVAAYRLNLTLVYGIDGMSKGGWQGRTMGINQLIVWTLSFAALFGVVQYSEAIIANTEDLSVHLMQGVAAGVVAAVSLMLMLLIRSAIGALVGVTCLVSVAAVVLNQAFGQPPSWSDGLLFHPGGSFVWLFVLQTLFLVACAFAMRANAYRLSRGRNLVCSSNSSAAVSA